MCWEGSAPRDGTLDVRNQPTTLANRKHIMNMGGYAQTEHSQLVNNDKPAQGNIKADGSAAKVSASVTKL